MKYLCVSLFHCLLFISILLALSGCGVTDLAPETAGPSQSTVASLSGSNYGGHAPIVGAHVFVLEAQAGSGGYGGQVKSLLSASSTATSGTYPVAQDTTTGSPTNGLYYVTTDGVGNFNITGDYGCDVGDPVYLAAYGGSPDNGVAISITAASETKAGSTYTITFTGNNLAYVGQQVAFTTLTGTYGTYLNNTTQTVTAVTTTTFTISYTNAAATISGTATGTATPVGVANPAIVNLAMMGVCGAQGGNFSSLKFIYMNEVSTAVVANAMAAFMTDPLHVGSSATNLLGLQNAANNAYLLYDVQGSNVSTVYDGEGHIARATTPAGNGTVDQSTLDTLGNILAACVDSANSYSPVSGTGTKSSQCTTLFSDATSTGKTGGTLPVDIATAALNIAKNPGTANVVALYNLPGTQVPFTPNLTAAPTDFTVAIKFTASGINGPQGIAVDANNSIWVTNFFPADNVTPTTVKLNADGTAATSEPYQPPAARTVAIDTSGNAWVTPQYGLTGPNGNVYELNNAGTEIGTFGPTGGMDGPFGVALDKTGNVYVSNYYGATYYTYKFSSTGTYLSSNSNCGLTTASDAYLASDPSGNVWSDGTFVTNTVCMVNSAGTKVFLATGFNGPGPFAIDGSGSAWVPNQGTSTTASGTGGALSRVTSAGAVTNFSGAGGLNTPAAVAIDGLGYIWVANAGNESVSEFTSTGTAVTTTGYRANSTTRAQGNLAIDLSGDVWFGWNAPALGSENTVTEIIGTAAPVVTPIVQAVKNNSLGTRP